MVGASVASRAVVVVATLVCAPLGCTVPELDLEGKACPCLDGWDCDEATQTCHRPADGSATTEAGSSSTTNGGSTTTSAATSDSASITTSDPQTTGGSSTTVGTQPGLFEVQTFSADWSTSESIHWIWTAEGEETDFHAWEVWVATSQDVLENGGEVIVFDDTVNPELGRFSLRNTETEVEVDQTITDGLDPATEYFAQLHVLDSAGGRSVSPNVAVRSTTPPPGTSVTLYTEGAVVGPAYELPDCFDVNSAAPYSGSLHYELLLECDGQGIQTCGTPGAAPDCWENLRLMAIDVSLADLNGGDFVDAFLEVHVAIDPPPPMVAHGWWSHLGVSASGSFHSFQPVTIRADGQYRRYQIPLSQLGLTHATLAGAVDGIRIGSQWTNGSTIRVDEATIRW